MRTRTAVLLSAAAILLAGSGLAVGVAVSGGDESPTAMPTATTVTERVTVTPTPSQTATSTPVATRPPVATTKPAVTTPPVPAVLNGAAVKQVFPGLTSPIPTGWVGEGSDQDSHAYADTSLCQTQAKNCPRVDFLSLTAGANRVNYGHDPIRQWAKNKCPERAPESVTTLTPLAATDGTTVLSYQLPCQGLENYAWYVPGKLLVMTGDATGGTAAPATVEAVLKYTSFN